MCQGDFLKQIEKITQENVYDAILLREKDLSPQEYLKLAKVVISLSGRENKKCILHNFPEVALELGHPYLHLPLRVWEEYKEKEFLRGKIKEMGTSVHSIEQAEKAMKLGADYVTAGHIFRTDCKKGLEPRGLGFLEKIVRTVSVPVYGIGGIHSDNEESVLEHGAAGVCIMSGCMKE